MNDERDKCKIFVITPSAKSKVLLKRLKVLSIDIYKVYLIGIRLYWDNGSEKIWFDSVEEVIGKVLPKDYLPEKNIDPTAYRDFLRNLYIEVKAFYDTAALANYRYFAFCGWSSDSLIAIFTSEPSTVEKVVNGPYSSILKVTCAKTEKS